MTTAFEIVSHHDADVDALFDASLSIDAHVDSMAASHERAVGGVTGGQIGLGETVTWRARHLGVWFTMTSQITELQRPARFVDQQVRGPFRSFVHVHEFHRVDGGTRMVDTITVASPVLGQPAERLVLVPYLRRLIRQRNAHLAAITAP
ncbi:SRPBCC family protein [Isoptericola aurantiacus]|uniref:SRPBCC family protein n=1 Tax=Isoptericola aurantiacus TaxID=3377839 RepID=UPI00383A6DAA